MTLDVLDMVVIGVVLIAIIVGFVYLRYILIQTEANGTKIELISNHVNNLYELVSVENELLDTLHKISDKLIPSIFFG